MISWLLQHKNAHKFIKAPQPKNDNFKTTLVHGFINIISCLLHKFGNRTINFIIYFNRL